MKNACFINIKYNFWITLHLGLASLWILAKLQLFWNGNSVSKTIGDLQCFIGFSNFYPLFIECILRHYNSISTIVLKKLGIERKAEIAFNILKTTFSTTTIFIHGRLNQNLLLWNHMLQTLPSELFYLKLDEIVNFIGQVNFHVIFLLLN